MAKKREAHRRKPGDSVASGNIHPIKNKRDLKRHVKAEIRAGKTRRDLYEELRVYYPEHSLAVMIGEFPENHLRKKYRPWSTLLGMMLITVATSHAFLFFSVFGIDTDSLYLHFILPVMLLFVAVWAFQFIPFAIRIAPILAYTDMIFIIYGLAAGAPDGTLDLIKGIPALAGFLSSMIIVWMSSFLKRKLMPGYGLLGPGRDHNGNYLL